MEKIFCLEYEARLKKKGTLMKVIQYLICRKNVSDVKKKKPLKNATNISVYLIFFMLMTRAQCNRIFLNS